MSTIQDIFSQLPYQHHAYGVESSISIYKELQKILPRDSFSYIVHKKYDTLKVDDARMLKSLQSEKTNQASLFILEFTLINIEAQNALLKVLEEPTPNTYFILVFPNKNKLLPTLKSRLEIIPNNINQIGTVNVWVDEFLDQNLQQRFDMIKEKTDKKKTPLTKSEILIFLNNLEVAVSGGDISAKALGSIFNARGYLHAKGASSKSILEMIAIMVPIKK